MEPVKKKPKYVQKSVFEGNQVRKGETALQQQKVEGKTRVVNVKVEYIRKEGYHNLLKWLENPNHIYVGRHNHYVPGAEKSKWANPFKVDKFGREECIKQFREYLLADKVLMSQLP